MAQVLITGANRGLGLEFTRQYAQAGWRVIACCRRPEQALKLQQIASHCADVTIQQLDVRDFDAIDALSADLDSSVIDLLINNAGVYGDSQGHGFGSLDFTAWTETLAINLQAPVKMAEAFKTQIKRSDKKMLIAISSQMGSIADNGSGGSLLYRSSKAGLNAAMKSLAIDLQAHGIGVIIFHPGWVRTDMGGPHGLIDVEQSISGMRQQIERFNIKDSGNFIKYDGITLPW